MTRPIFEDDDILSIQLDAEFIELKHTLVALTAQRFSLRRVRNAANASYVDERVNALTSVIEKIIAQTGENPTIFSLTNQSPKVPDNVVLFKRH